jgi:HSP20 family protein
MPDETSLHGSSGRRPATRLAAGGDPLRRWVIVRHVTVWQPATDVYEHDGRLIVLVEIAGMNESDFNVTLHGQTLIISGLRRRMTAEDCAYHQLEIPFGEFRTEVSLPWPVTREEVSAHYRDGFLRVELPQAPAQKIQIVNREAGDSHDDQQVTHHG